MPTAPTTSPVKLTKATLRAIPGYDPFASAGNCTFDKELAQRALDFFAECLTFTAGEKAGEPFKLERWQVAIVGNLFGWVRPDGTRRYREAYIEVPKKNGKTELSGGLGNLLTFADGEPGAEVYCAAGDALQAGLVFKAARVMVEHEPELFSRANIYRRSIEVPGEVGAASVFVVMSSEPATKHGYNSHGVIVDELHVQPNRDLVDTLTTGIASRRQPLVIYITTAGWDRNSICWEKHEYAEKVRDGQLDDPSFLPVIHAADEQDDWTSPKVWKKANPNFGISVGRDYFKRECMKARNTPTYENTFKRLHLNIWTEQAVRFLQMAKWDACDAELEPDKLKGLVCYAGLDLSTTTDITALVLLFPVEDDYHVLPFFWVPKERAREREKRDRVPYYTWAQQGLIEMTPGDVIDYRYVRRRINELVEKFQVQEIGYDPYNATQLALQLQDEDGVKMIEVRQGMITLNEPTKELERLVISGHLVHGGNPVLRWMASNVTVQTDAAGNLKPSKDKSTERIDGITAMITGLARWMVSTDDSSSAYDNGGIFTI